MYTVLMNDLLVDAIFVHFLGCLFKYPVRYKRIACDNGFGARCSLAFFVFFIENIRQIVQLLPKNLCMYFT